MQTVADDYKVRVDHPLTEPAFLSALAARGRRKGLGDRKSIMRLVFGDLLPDPALARESKAYFDGAMWAEATRAFVTQWNEQGVDLRLVDPVVLRNEWNRDSPRFTSACLLQAARLSSLLDPEYEVVTTQDGTTNC
jgi:hypothetical protein